MANPAEKISILLVEDHAVTMEGIQAWFQKDDNYLIVGTAGDSETALEMARDSNPQVILLDLHIPGNKPIDRVITDLVATASKVVIFSAEDRAYLIDLAMQSGASAFLSKSENYQTISETVRRVAQGSSGIISRVLRNSTRQFYLTLAEKQLLQFLAQGMKYDEIASLRCTSPHTVRKQCDLLQVKLKLDSREEVIVWAVRNGYGQELS